MTSKHLVSHLTSQNYFFKLFQQNFKIILIFWLKIILSISELRFQKKTFVLFLSFKSFFNMENNTIFDNLYSELHVILFLKFH